MDFKPYYRKVKCDNLKVPYKSKVDIAKEFVKNFNAPQGLKQLYILMDCWYTSQTLIDASLSKGYHLIGGIKSSRTIYPCGVRLKISEFIQYISPNTLGLVTVRGKKYRVYQYEGKVGNFENSVLLISYEVKEKAFENTMSILCTDIDLETQTILEYYSVRWSIETSYQYLKQNLGFDQYRVRSRISIGRYFLLCFLAYNLLEIYRVTQVYHKIGTVGEPMNHHKRSAHRNLVDLIYY